MMEPRDQMDRAIDQVASQMVTVEHDDALAQRIAASLPDRSKATWFVGLMPHAAAAAVIILVVIGVVRHDRSAQSFDTDVLPSRSAQSFGPFVRPVRSTGERSFVSNVRAERSGRTNVSNDMFDKEYGLPPIAFEAIADVTEIAPAQRELAPIVLTELPVLDDSSRD